MEIDGGYILIARKIFYSEIMSKPPLYMKLWVWMLGQANHKDRGKIKRGQLHTSTPDMQNAMSHKVGYRVSTPTRDEIRSAYEAFMKAGMITTTKTTHGMVITICNYEEYQNPKNYEAHTEPPAENTTKPQTTPHYTQECKKESKSSSSKKVSGYSEDFIKFWEMYPRKVAKDDAWKAWQKNKPVLSDILKALEWQTRSENWTDNNGKYIPYPATYLNKGQWKDEPLVQCQPQLSLIKPKDVNSPYNDSSERVARCL